MDLNRIREALRSRPFHPFTLRLSDGRELGVPHPDFVAVAPTFVFFVHHESGAVLELEPFQIVSIDFGREKLQARSISE